MSSVDSGQSTMEQEAVACCEACAQTREMVRQMHSGFMALANSLPAMLNNPMLKTMARSFGVDVDAMSKDLKK